MSATPKEVTKETIIYIMKDPVSLDIRYVGKTCNSLENRLKGHLYRAKLEKNHRAY